MNFGFIFVNFNNTNFTKEAIQSLLSRNEELNVPVVIVDNGSCKDSVQELKEIERIFPSVKVIFNTINVGYFKGLNLGIAVAKNDFSNIDYWVIGNNDLLFPKAFGRMLLGAKKVLDMYPVVSPNITTLDGKPQNPHVISSISKSRELVYDIYHLSYALSRVVCWVAFTTRWFTDRSDEKQFNVAQEIYQGYGACYILGPRFFENFTELWAPSFLMYEEFFLAKQLEGIGFKTFYEPSIKVVHQCKGATGAVPGKFKWQCSRDSHSIYRKYVKLWF
jgi:GT2 family glycosyltransferase